VRFQQLDVGFEAKVKVLSASFALLRIDAL